MIRNPRITNRAQKHSINPPKDLQTIIRHQHPMRPPMISPPIKLQPIHIKTQNINHPPRLPSNLRPDPITRQQSNTVRHNSLSFGRVTDIARLGCNCVWTTATGQPAVAINYRS